MNDGPSLYQWVPEEWKPSKPPATLAETWAASRELQAGDNSDAHDRRIERAYRTRLEAINAHRRREGLPEMLNPVQGIRLLDRPDTSNPYAVMGGAAGTARQAQVGQDTAQADVMREIRRIRAIDPDFLPGVSDDPATIMEEEYTRERTRRGAAREVLDRSEGVVAGAVGIAGSISKSIEDPLVIATLPIGGGGTTITGMMAREFALNFGLTLMMQPQVARNREEIGEELTLGEAFGNATGAGVGAAGVTGAVGVTVKMLRGGAVALSDGYEDGLAKLYDALPEKVRKRWAGPAEMNLPDAIEAVVPPDQISPDLRAAINVMRRDAEVTGSMPFRAGGANGAAHADRLADAMTAQARGAPVPRETSSAVSRGRLASGTGLASGTTPAPSVDRVFESLIIQESSGKAGAVGVETKWGRAYGLTQVLDSTGAQMAKKLGIAWQPELMRARTPEGAAYQRRIGRAYFDEGLAKYRGDVRRALMYYHGGPDERLWGPKTRAYADSVLARAGVAPETRIADAGDGGELDGTLARLDAERVALDAEAATLARDRRARAARRGAGIGQDGQIPLLDPVEMMPVPMRATVAGADDADWMQGPRYILDEQPDTGAPGIEIVDKGDGVVTAVYRAEDGSTVGAARVAVDDVAMETYDPATVYVEPEFRRQGIASRMYDALEDAGYPVTARSGAGDLTPDGAAFASGWRGAPSDTNAPLERIQAVFDVEEPDGWLPRLAGAVETIEAKAPGRLDADDPIWEFIDAMEARELGRAAPANDIGVVGDSGALAAHDVPGGTAQAGAVDSVMHDLRVLAESDPSITVRIDADGAERPLAQLIAELDEDDAVIAAVKGCL